jgi:excisionase family DNA binding protein
MDDVFLTTEEVLEYLQVNLRTVYRLIKAGKIPAVRVGRQWRFRKTDIDRWLSSQTSAPAPSEIMPVQVAQSVERPSGRRPRVLVVDDEASIRELLTKTLALAEYEVQDAPDGRAALALVRATTFDLLVTDLKMPGMDGLALIRDARRLVPTLPVIIITAYSTEASAIEAANLGVAGYLTKPFRIAKILTTVAKALGE